MLYQLSYVRAPDSLARGTPGGTVAGLISQAVGRRAAS